LTNCLAIDEIQSQNDTHFTLEINHVESYYNFRTVGNDLKLVTSGLSINTNLTDIVAFEKTKQTHKYVIRSEAVIEPIITNFENLYCKKSRIQAIIGEGSFQNLNNQQLNNMQIYFGRDMSPLTTSRSNPQKNPKYCRATFQSHSNPACSTCFKNCRYSIEMILDPIKGLSKEDILLELKNHNHPKTRIMPDLRQRDLSEAR
jgi:hypothetical protein